MRENRLHIVLHSREVGLEHRKVGLERRNVGLKRRDIDLEAGNVALQASDVELETRDVNLEMGDVSSDRCELCLESRLPLLVVLIEAQDKQPIDQLSLSLKLLLNRLSAHLHLERRHTIGQ